MKKKKIAFFLTSMNLGGAEGKAATLINHLSSQYEIQLILFDKEIAYPLPSGLIVTHLKRERVFKYKLSQLLFPIILFRYYLICKKNNIEISYSYGYVPNIISCFIRYFGWDGKIILNHINYSKLELGNNNNLKNRLISFFVPKLYQEANYIIAPSKGILNDLTENLKLPLKKLKLIHNPVNINKINKLSKELIPSSIESKSKFTFLHVGNNRKQKNHELLLNAFSKLTEQDCELWLIGNGDLKSKWEKRVMELGISKKVQFIGFTENPYKYMKKSDCLVLSSDHEGLPNVLLEALVCELPIISTDCLHGPREILSPESNPNIFLKNTIEVGKYGILTPVGNVELLSKSMKMIIEKQEISQKLTVNSLERANDFKLDINLQRNVEIIG